MHLSGTVCISMSCELSKCAEDWLEVYGTSEQLESVSCGFVPEELQT